MKKAKPKLRYTVDLPGRMYMFFISYEDRGAPSISKFAKSIGSTVEEIEKFRRHRQFDRAYRECNEIRKDYLIDRALDKRFDPSFVKYLLSEEPTGVEGDGELTLRLEVSD